VKTLLTKLGTHSRLQAAVLASREGLVAGAAA
jgi:DNA-binding NarL/FixJ family response regulator